MVHTSSEGCISTPVLLNNELDFIKQTNYEVKVQSKLTGLKTDTLYLLLESRRC